VNPCKHIAAAYYILAERFDQDPFQIFAWRGREQTELLEHLRARRAGASAAGGASRAAHRSGTAGAGTARPAAPESRDPALVDELDSFWESRPALADLNINPLAAEATDVLLRQLGPAPVDVDGQNLVDLLAPVYRVLAGQAERRALK
jgi:uncharacterized Zn finger protein